MWLSKMMSKSSLSDKAEKGRITLSQPDNVEAESTVTARNINTYTPYGFTSLAPIGEEVILIPSSDGQVAVGTKNDSSDLQSGEVKIASKGGACIILKNDGSVIINSMKIDKNGVIES
jgi:phage gp45-like